MALSTRRWLRDPLALLAVGLTAYAALYAVAVAGAAPTNAAVQTILLAAFLPMDAGIVALAWIAAARIPLEGNVGVRRALELTGVGFMAVLGGAVARFIYVHWFGGDPQNGWVNLPHLLLYPCWLVALLALPRAQRMPAERRKFLYDAATTLLGVGIAVWHLVLIPTIRAEPRTGVAHFLSVADAAGAIALVLGLTTVWLQRPRRYRGPFVLLLLSIALHAASGLAGLLVHVRAGQMAAPWMSLTFMGPYVLLVWACQRFASHPPEAAREGASMGRGRVQPFSPLPYVALASCYALLLGEAVRHADEHWASLAEGTLLVTLLIVLRQLAAVRENVAARRRNRSARERSPIPSIGPALLRCDRNCRWPRAFLRFVSPSVTRLVRVRAVGARRGAADVPAASRRRGAGRGGIVDRNADLGRRPPPPNGAFAIAMGGGCLSKRSARICCSSRPCAASSLNARDVSERKALEAQLTHQAFHDPLTGLANRALFFDRVTHALERGRAMAMGWPCCFSTSTTSRPSTTAWATWRATVCSWRPRCDSPSACATSDTVARLGGDEFAVLIEDANAELASAWRPSGSRPRCGQPFALEGKEVFVTASLGIAVRHSGVDRVGAAAQRRHGDVHREEPWQSTVRAVRDAHASGGARPPRAGGRPTPRAGACGIHLALSADRLARRRGRSRGWRR